MQLRTYHAYAALPPEADALFAAAGSGDLFRSRDWLECVDIGLLRPGDRLRLHALGDAAGAPRVLLPAQYSRLYGSHPGSRVLHFLLPEDRPYEPLVAGAGMDPARIVSELMAAIRENPRSYDVLRVSPLLPASPFARAIIDGLRATRHFLQIYRQPLDCFAGVAGLSYADYLAARPRALRESLERGTRLLMQGGRGRFFLVRTPEHVDDAWQAVSHLVGTATTEGEPEPLEYLRSVLDAAARADALRLGLLFQDDVPAAFQLWVVSAGVAHCLRLMSDPGRQVFPLDDILTQMMALCLIDGDRVAELDFGAVSPEFARDWARLSREQIGVVAFNRSTLRGWRGALRHIGKQQLKAVPVRLWRALTRRR